MKKELEGIRMKTKYAAILNLVEDDNKLLPLTRRRPIASLPFACRYRLIDFPFSSLTNAEVPSAALFISGTGRSLYDHIRSGITWGLDNPTGGGVFTHSQLELKSKFDEGRKYSSTYYEDHANYITRSKADYVVISGSRILANIQIKPMTNYHLQKQSDITVAYKKIKRNELKEDTSYSAYILESETNTTVKGLEPIKNLPADVETVAFGLDFLLAKKEVVLDYLRGLQENDMPVSVSNILRLATKRDHVSINAYEYTGYMKAIEDIRSYFEANMDMLNEDNFNALFFRESPVLTKSKNSAPTYYGKDSVVKHSLLANDSEIYGSVEDSLVSRKNMLCERASVKNSIILQSCFIDEDAVIEYAILDKNVYIEKGAKLIGTAENPLVVPKDARVLSTGEIVEG